MATRAQTLNGPAGKKLTALVRKLGSEPRPTNKAQHDAWRELVVGSATALFRLVGRKAVMANLTEPHEERLTTLLAETAAAARELASAATS